MRALQAFATKFRKYLKYRKTPKSADYLNGDQPLIHLMSIFDLSWMPRLTGMEEEIKKHKTYTVKRDLAYPNNTESRKIAANMLLWMLNAHTYLYEFSWVINFEQHSGYAISIEIMFTDPELAVIFAMEF